MMRIVSATCILLALASGLAAGPTLAISNPVFEGNEFHFDLVITSVDSLNDYGVLGFAAGAVLSGPGTAHLRADTDALMHNDTSLWQALIGPGGRDFALAELDGTSCSANWVASGEASNAGAVDGTHMTFSLLDQYCHTTVVEVGQVVARFR